MHWFCCEVLLRLSECRRLAAHIVVEMLKSLFFMGEELTKAPQLDGKVVALK